MRLLTFLGYFLIGVIIVVLGNLATHYFYQTILNKVTKDLGENNEEV